MQVVHHSLEALRLTGHVLLVSFKLLARARDGTTKHKVAQRTQLTAAIEGRIALVLRWFQHAVNTAAAPQLQEHAGALTDEVRQWLANPTLLAALQQSTAQVTADAMQQLLGASTADGVLK